MQWTWFVPQNVEGMVELMGVYKCSIANLDYLFTPDFTLVGNNISAEIYELIGKCNDGNEPSHHILHLYNKVGQPWKTQALVDSVLHSQYFNNPNGLSGNEDCGQMSAWYVLNAMGFYQLCPGNPEYSIGRPLFDAITIRLPQGKEFKIVVQNNSAENKYIESAVLNRTVLSKPYFTHQQLMEGGTLQVVMTNQPTKWGTE